MYLMYLLYVLNFRGCNFLTSSKIASYVLHVLCVYKWLESVQFRHAICTCMTGWNSVVTIRTTSFNFPNTCKFPTHVFCADLTRKDDHSLKLREAAGLHVYDCLVPGYIFIFVQRNSAQSSLRIFLRTQNCNYSLRYCSYSLQRGQAWPHWREVAAQKIWPVLEAVVTVLCTPDDGCGWHPKHVEWTCRIIDCFVLHLVGQLLIQISDARNHKHKIGPWTLSSTI